MSANPVVNRYLQDKAMDRIDHALGRPLYQLAETYREYFAVDTDSDLAACFRSSPHWKEGGVAPGGMAYFHVSPEGRQALVDHLRSIESPHRGFLVSYEGHESLVAARSRGSARYSAFLSVSDCFCDLTFGEFVRQSTVRIARAGA
jgi:hypothetical protein